VLRVLLVCTGNICRSPIAHGFLVERSARLLGGAFRVRSAGTHAYAGSPPTDEAVAAAAERGVAIAAHRSARFDLELGSWADLVVTMTAEQRDDVVEGAPELVSKTFTLKELVALLGALPPVTEPPSRDGMVTRVEQADQLRREGTAPGPVDEDVADPLGLGVEAYRATCWEIEELVDATVRGLAGAPVPVREP